MMEIGLVVLLVVTVKMFDVSLERSTTPVLSEVQESWTVETPELSVAAEDDLADQQEEAETTAAEVILPGQYPIMGLSGVTAAELVAYFRTSGLPYPEAVLASGGADSIEAFCQMFIEEAETEGVRPEVAFVQTMKETGWLQYGGDAAIEQFNFAGLGTTGGGVPGHDFSDVRTGIRAQVQHLKAYASEEELVQACVDERYDYVPRGSAPYVEWLGQQENPGGHGWATGENYGYSIVEMIHKLRDMK